MKKINYPRLEKFYKKNGWAWGGLDGVPSYYPTAQQLEEVVQALEGELGPKPGSLVSCGRLQLYRTAVGKINFGLEGDF